DDTRAAEFIRRLRDLLRKTETKHVVLDMNVLVRDVTRLVSSDAIIRNVVLNLLVNAMDAVADSRAERRMVVVHIQTDGDAVHVAVRDNGPGLRDDSKDLIFEPFFTTKPTGMGMG